MCRRSRSSTTTTTTAPAAAETEQCDGRISSCHYCCSIPTTFSATTTRRRSGASTPPAAHRSSLIRLFLPMLIIIIILCCCWLPTVQCTPPPTWDTVPSDSEMETASDKREGNDGTFLTPAASLSDFQRRLARRISEQEEATAPRGGLGWRKRRYYVGRWGSSDGQQRRATSRRFVPLSTSDESGVDGSVVEQDEMVKQQQRLCGLKLTNRTKQLCGDCVPANMRQVILLDKRHGAHASSQSRTGHNGAIHQQQQAFSKERLTEMCCVQRCTDDQIRNFCCRARTQQQPTSF